MPPRKGDVRGRGGFTSTASSSSASGTTSGSCGRAALSDSEMRRCPLSTASTITCTSWPGFTTSITRRTREGEVIYPQEKITRQEALKMWTIWPAWLQFGEKTRGSIETGVTRAVVNSYLAPTAAFVMDGDIDFEAAAMHRALRTATGERGIEFVDGSGLATALMGASPADQSIHRSSR